MIKDKVEITGSKYTVLKEAQILGEHDRDEMIEVFMHLKHKQPLPSLEELCSGSSIGQARLTQKEFADRYGASAQDVERIKTFAKKYELEVKEVNSSQRIIVLVGKASNFSNAFSVKLLKYRHKEDTFRGYEGHIHIPAELEDIVQGVFGLQNQPLVKPYVKIFCSSEDSNASCTQVQYTPTQIASVYNFPKGLDGTGQTIGIIELGGGYDATVLKDQFENTLKVKLPQIKDVCVGTGQNTPGKNQSCDLEVELDIEIAGAIANGSQLVVYFGPDSSGPSFLQTMKAAVHDQENHPSIISVSWGMCELTWDQSTREAFDEVLQEAAVLGITVCTASGDYGSYDRDNNQLANVDYPSSSPYALACGGTYLELSDITITKENVWNVIGHGVTGGGVSSIYPVPPYQSKAALNPISVNAGGKAGRGVPDVAGVAEPGFALFVDGSTLVRGGTSAVAPLWSALIALCNQKLNTKIGFINTFLYNNAQSSKAFHDITEGNNSVFGIPGYSAVSGWDACTGWGSPNGEAILQILHEHIEGASSTGVVAST